ncbi:MAG TPA: hypothetical protein VLG13_00085 [Patescibacteria group bacterium]|nr:hypothetical protein [Patescibacteria group bacterium]
MKQKDIALIAVVVVASAILSIVASKFIFAPPKNRQQPVEVVQPISSDFQIPDSRYFNSKSIDPTKLITIGGDNTNPDPFSNKQ